MQRGATKADSALERSMRSLLRRDRAMQYLSKPHVSPALASLRRGVTFSALVVGAAAAAQLLVFGCVHFTRVRFTETQHEASSQPLSVVLAPRHIATAKESVRDLGGGKEAKEAKESPKEAPKEAESGPPLAPPAAAVTPGAPPEPLRIALPVVLSDADATLHTLSDLAVIAGMLGTVALAAFVAMGLVVAAGAAVPGIELVVSAAGYALMLAIACVPWRDVFVSVPFPGVFGGYDVMTEMSGEVNAGAHAAPLFTIYLAMPLAAMVGSLVALGKFRAGVAAGVIATSPSELDERLDREMAAIRSRGVTAGTPRAMAALHQAIGETPAEAPPAVPPAAAGSGAGAQEHPATRRSGPPRMGRGWLGRDRRIGEPDPGDPLKRPI